MESKLGKQKKKLGQDTWFLKVYFFYNEFITLYY